MIQIKPDNAAYQQTLDYLFTRLPMFSRIGMAAYRKDLNNIIRICDYLEHPEKKFKSIHIAGTNGKGSVSHMLAAILQTAGYCTGLYTSPHLRDFRERIRVNGNMVDERFVTSFTENMKPLVDEIDPSFFEITVGMAFEYFARQKVDMAVIETGLGGRFDSTNIVIPEVSVITNIGWDHMNILGNTLEKIAFEKAGIIKNGVPVIVGETLPETEPVFRKIAEEHQAPIQLAADIRHSVGWRWEKQHLIVEVSQGHKTDHFLYRLDLPGIYQTKNILTVLAVCAELREKGWLIDEEHISTGLLHAKKITGLHGRWDVIHQQPLVVLDVAHNENGIKMLMEQIEVTDHDHLHIILGVAKDKEFSRMLALLPQLADYYFTQADIPRALPAEQLQEQARSFGLNGNIYRNVNEALAAAKAQANKTDLILICGSVFLVGEVN